jgi:hypothetical protein
MPLRSPFAACLDEGRLELVDRGGAAGDKGQVANRSVGHRHPHRGAVQLARERRIDEADRLGSAGRSRDNVDRSRPCTAHVLGVLNIEDSLVVGVRVGGREPTVLDADRLVEDLGHRRQTVGGARSVRDHLVLGGVVEV